MRFKFLCDFDGTIVQNDLTYLTLKLFAEPGWEIYDEKYQRGKINLEQCLISQITMISASKEKILAAVKPSSIPRHGFHKFIEFCKQFSHQFWIVSAGLDFIIEDFLKTHNFQNIPLYSPKTQFNQNKIDLSFPKRFSSDSSDFKGDFALQQADSNYKIIAIGDGGSDYSLARNCDLTFAVKDSPLAIYCKHNKIRNYEFETFNSIIKILERKSFNN